MAKLFIEDIDIRGKRLVIRVDFNVPIRDGKVDNDKRLRASLPTIQYALEQGASLVLMSHLGRPNGQAVDKFSLAPVAEHLSGMLGKPIKFLDDCVGEGVEKACAELQVGEIILLENLRFHIEEQGKGKATDDSKIKADPEAVAAFRASLSKLGDIYVNDAFGTSHRAHSSMVGVDLPQKVSGYLLKKELDFLGDALGEPKRPFVAIIGGAKISGKIDVIEALLPKVDHLLIGGGMAYTFYKAKGLEIGNSLLEEDKVELAGKLIEVGGDKLLLPEDCAVTDKLDFGARTIGKLEMVADNEIAREDEAVDIGPRTAGRYCELIRGAGTVVWNGPMGVFEIDETARGTFAVANALAEATEQGCITIIGGGDSAAAIEKAGLADRVSHVSTGGGASLEFLEGKELPGVVALSDK